MTWRVAAAMSAALAMAGAAAAQNTLAQRNESLFQQLQQQRQLSNEKIGAIRAIFAQSGFIGQGNPAISEHPETEQQCREKLARQGVVYANPQFEKICGAKFMAPLYDPRKTTADKAQACIDQFEYPDMPCTYPVVWVKAREAAQLCAAEGKRICDAHEWEGACAGALEEPDYPFALVQGVSPEAGVERMRAAHNRVRQADKSWSYGPVYLPGICATGSHKTPGCPGGGWKLCGSNTYPTGDFPACHSSLDVYDLNGNAAEHMNLPLAENQMASRGSQVLGYTEMKGSWFIFDTYRAHEDWCRWRAPFWHGTPLMDPHSHANYHLGFRCCATIATSR